MLKFLPLPARADPRKKATLCGVALTTWRFPDPRIHVQLKYTQTHAHMPADTQRYTKTHRHMYTPRSALTNTCGDACRHKDT